MKTGNLKLSRGCELLALVIAGSLTFLFLPDANAAESYAFVKMWPEKKEEWGFSPRDVAVDSSGYVYLADSGSIFTTDTHRVHKFDSSGNVVSDWPGGALIEKRITARAAYRSTPLQTSSWWTRGTIGF